MAATQAIILFGHGARDARWREPFDRLQAKLSALRPDCLVRLAFLELMAPSLSEAVAELAAAGVTDIAIVPVFIGRGGHLRRDLPVLVDACRSQFPAIHVTCETAVGEADSVLDAMAAYCGQAVSGHSRP